MDNESQPVQNAMNDAQRAARAQFDRQAEQYNQRWASWTDETLKKMLAIVQPQKDWRVLDVATGTGFTALAFAEFVGEVVGLDISPGMLAQAAKRAAEQGVANITWQESPAESLPFPDESFDLVTVRIAPHHFSDVSAFLRETRRVLKPGEALVLGDTTVPDDAEEAATWQNAVEKARDASHVHNLSPSEWREACQSAGLTVTHCDYLPGAIPVEVSAWMETSGCAGDAANVVREFFANAPESAQREFRIQIDPETGETHFSWARIVLQAVRP
jgi:ubiquinone/menaquinone biosynthesis C-methylase UbiE